MALAVIQLFITYHGITATRATTPHCISDLPHNIIIFLHPSNISPEIPQQANQDISFRIIQEFLLYNQQK